MRTLLRLKNVIFNAMQKGQKMDALTMKEKQEIVSSLGTPRDLYERSYYQYVCQKKANSSNTMFKLFYLLLNIPAFFVIVFLLIKPFKLPIKTASNNEIDAVCMFDEKLKDRIPVELSGKYNNLIFAKNTRCVLIKKDKKLLLKLWKKYPISFNFLLKNMLKIGEYRFCLCRFNSIKTFITASEYSYTSSFMTEFCNKNNVKHINVMHGESVFELTKTFFCYDECYVWDEFYITLYSSMGACKKQFIVAIPPCLKFADVDASQRVQYKYYMQSQTKTQMAKIKSILEKITDNYMVRPHPLYTDIRSLKEIFDEQRIESCDIPISESIMENRYIMAWDSTVLLQGYLNGKSTIIDDITNPIRSKSMEDGYIMADKGMKLSQVLRS